jgi:galactokinase
MSSSVERAIAAFREQFDGEPMLAGSAPGRVNLIGEHTDYNDGFVLPCAINRRVAVALGRGEGRLYSDDFGDVRTVGAGGDGSWAEYPRAVDRAVRERGGAGGAWDGAFAGDVPLGAGLSSSAAIECATALVLNEFDGLGLSRRELAVTCQRAENAYVGVQSGIMDQYASLLCTEGDALLIDCRSLTSTAVPLRLAQAGLTLLVCDTKVERGLGKTAYNERRASCEQAARELGVASLRDATVGDLARLRGEALKRARHVVTENQRVLAAVEALSTDDFARMGRLMVESHVSLRDDYEVSIAPLDVAVDVAVEAGAPGARLTGAGFGGCAIALAPVELVDAISEAISAAFAVRGFTAPQFYTFDASQGAQLAR